MPRLDRFNQYLHQYRVVAVVVSLAVILYTNIYLWGMVPFADFAFNWRPDHQLHVVGAFDEGAASASLLQEDDIVVAIDGKPVNRAAAIYTVPRQPSYELTITRNDQTLVVDVPFPATPGSLATSFRLPSGILSIVTGLSASLSSILLAKTIPRRSI